MMTNAEYISLWNNNDSLIYLILQDEGDFSKDYGTMVISKDNVDPYILLERGIKLGYYPDGSYLMEIVDFGDEDVPN